MVFKEGDLLAINIFLQLKEKRLTFEFACILERSGKMSGATICYVFFVFNGLNKRPF